MKDKKDKKNIKIDNEDETSTNGRKSERDYSGVYYDDPAMISTKQPPKLESPIIEAMSGSLETNEYRYYSGSVFFDTDTAVESLRLSAQDSGSTFTVDFVGMFKGENSYIPNDNLVLEKEVTISDLTSGQSRKLIQFPYPNLGVKMNVTALATDSGFTVFRSINSMPYMITNGTARSRVFWSNTNTFGYDSVTSTNSFDFIYGRNDSRLDYFSRTADLSAFDKCLFKFELIGE